MADADGKTSGPFSGLLTTGYTRPLISEIFGASALYIFSDVSWLVLQVSRTCMKNIRPRRRREISPGGRER